MILRLPVVAAAALAGLVLADAALACVCAQMPMSERLDDSDVAFVGRVESEREGSVRGEPVRLLTIAVEQRLTVDQLAATFTVYPSLSGSVAEAARRLHIAAE